MGDELFDYVKKSVDKWRSEVRDLVTIDQVLTNFSIMACDKCGGEGMVMAGGKAVDCDKCGPPHNDGLHVFRFSGSVVAIEEKLVLKEVGEPPAMLYVNRAKNAKVKFKNKQVSEERRTAYFFTVDDGENQIRCCVHNFRYVYPNGFDDVNLPHMAGLIREAQTTGARIMVRGKPFPYKEGKLREIPCVFVDNIDMDRSDFDSRLTFKDVEEFILKCKNTQGYAQGEARPLDIARVELWRKMIVPDYLKDALMLWCISPKSHQEQLHIVLITDPGEGKDYMHKKVLAPFARIGVAGSRLTSSIPALIGAMSSSNLSKISVGLLPRFHNARVVVSEFSTWTDEMWSALLGVMAEGEVILSKGEISGRRRPACLNLLLLGNPPKGYIAGASSKMDTLQTFGNFTYPMVSRSGLIFCEPHLTDDEDAVRQKMMENVDTDTSSQEDPRLRYFQDFFKEYFKYVSSLKTPVLPAKRMIDLTFDQISDNPDFRDFLTTQGRKDKRKYLQFINICKSYARANGRIENGPDGDFISLSATDIRKAGELFQRSAASLADNFDVKLLGISPSDQRILRYIIEHPGQTQTQIRRALKLQDDKNDTFVLTSFRTLENIGRIHCVDDTYWPDRVDDLPTPRPVSSSTDTKREEVPTAPSSVSPPHSLGEAVLEKYKRAILSEFKIDDTVADALAEFYDGLKNLPESFFARKVYELSHGQVPELLARDVHVSLRRRGL